jgi:hypothetical protein
MTTTAHDTLKSEVEQSTDVIRQLLAATAAGEGDLGSLLDALRPDQVARVLVDEIVFRACLEDFTIPGSDSASVGIVFQHGGKEFATTVSVGPDGVEIDRSGAVGKGLATPAVAQDLGEAARALYGPAQTVSSLTRSLRWPGPEIVFPTPERPSLPTVFYAVVQRVVQVLDRLEPTELSELAVRYGTDKWGSMHQYPHVYERHLNELQDRKMSILEIGIGGFNDPAQGGGSMRMWKRYFRRALISGIDILDKAPVAEPRMLTMQADQSSVEDLARVAERFGPFDIVIDDGSHNPKHVLTSFHALFPHVRSGGLYIIEDLQATFWPEYFGGNDTDLNDPTFTVGFLKALLDGLHHEDFLRDDAREALPTDQQITGVHVYRNLAFIEKAPNNEGSLVASLLRAERQKASGQNGQQGS